MSRLVIIIDLPAILLSVTDSEQAVLFRQWLIELIRPEEVYLIAHREQRYRAALLSMLTVNCAWSPAQAFFKRGHEVNPHQFYRQAVVTILSRLEPAQTGAVIGLSGLEYGRQILRKLAIPAFDPDTGPWSTLPVVRPKPPTSVPPQLKLFE